MSKTRPLPHSHMRLLLSIAVVGILAGIATPSYWQPITRILAGWNIAVWANLLQMGWRMMRASQARIKIVAEQQDDNAVVVMATLSIAASLSLVAIIFELASAKGLPDASKWLHYLFTAVTVVGSWLLVAMIYTFHYARIFYRSPENQRSLHFPEGEINPNYWDFLYFSFTIAVAAQTSDVIVMSRAMRKAVLAQSVLSFLFNAAIIGMSINIAAGLIGS